MARASLQIAYPNIAAEWHPIKNGDLLPSLVTYGSGRKVWWQCSRGHEWLATPNDRTRNEGRGRGCPNCSVDKREISKKRTLINKSGSLAAHAPELASQWHPVKNGTLSPMDVTVYSNRKAWWKCSKGHEWEAVVASRSSSMDML